MGCLDCFSGYLINSFSAEGLLTEEEIKMIEAAENRTDSFARNCRTILARLISFMKTYDAGRRWGQIADKFGELFTVPPTVENKRVFNEIMSHFIYLLKK